MSPDAFTCKGCGSAAFTIGTKETVGEGTAPMIDSLACRDCGESYDALPRPSKLIRRREDG